MASLCWADRGIIVLSEYRIYLEGHYCRVESGSRKRTGRSFNDKAAKVSSFQCEDFNNSRFIAHIV